MRLAELRVRLAPTPVEAAKLQVMVAAVMGVFAAAQIEYAERRLRGR
jgi:hypothetical protein